jgi:hypothetical protein
MFALAFKTRGESGTHPSMYHGDDKPWGFALAPLVLPDVTVTPHEKGTYHRLHGSLMAVFVVRNEDDETCKPWGQNPRHSQPAIGSP